MYVCMLYLLSQRLVFVCISVSLWLVIVYCGTLYFFQSCSCASFWLIYRWLFWVMVSTTLWPCVKLMLELVSTQLLILVKEKETMKLADKSALLCSALLFSVISSHLICKQPTVHVCSFLLSFSSFLLHFFLYFFSSSFYQPKMPPTSFYWAKVYLFCIYIGDEWSSGSLERHEVPQDGSQQQPW